MENSQSHGEFLCRVIYVRPCWYIVVENSEEVPVGTNDSLGYIIVALSLMIRQRDTIILSNRSKLLSMKHCFNIIDIL